MRRCRPRACDGERAFELILIQSYSRFFREAFEQEFYLRKLAKHGVRVVSITQPVGDESEPVHAMMARLLRCSSARSPQGIRGARLWHGRHRPTARLHARSG